MPKGIYTRPLTPLQLEALSLIRAYLAEHGYPPTISELAQARGVAPFCMVGHLRALRAKGLIDWEPRKSRTLRLISPERA